MDQHSRYWLDDELFDQDDSLPESPEGADLQKIARLAAIRRAVSNFVSILSGKNIPVQFSSGKQSYTDGDRVVIAADDDPSKFDVMVGLALHEGSHVLLTDFEHLRTVMEFPVRGTSLLDVAAMKNILHPAVRGELPEFTELDWRALNNLMPHEEQEYQTAQREWHAKLRIILDDLKQLMNILEDRRIDKYVFQRAGGYRPYYVALYNRYFFTSEIGRNLRFNPKWREVTVENYINRLLFMFHPAAKPDALPGLEFLYKMVDIANIERIAPQDDSWKNDLTFENQPALWREANLLYAYILKYAKLGEIAQQEQEPAEGEQGVPMKMPQHLSDLPDLDGGPQSFEPVPVEQDTKGKGKKQEQVPGRYNEAKAKKELDQAKKVMNGDTRKKKLTKQEQTAVDALDSADAKLVDIKGDGVPFGKCMVTRKMTRSLMAQDWFIFKRWSWETGRATDQALKSVAAGKRLGQILHHRLQVRNDPLLTKQTRLPQGGLDRRLLAQLGMDITSVFQKSRVDQHRPAMLHLTLDASGSMGGRKWDKVRSVAVALAYIGSKLRNVDTVVSIRGGNEMPMVAILFDSRKDQFNSFLNYIKVIEPAGATPEGLCFKATMDLILECSATHDVYFVNFSDGEPSFSYSAKSSLSGKNKHRGSTWQNYFNYQGDVATKHTRKMIQTMREAGVKVMSYFISEQSNYSNYDYPGSSRRVFGQMYGESAEFVNVENAGEVVRTLNKLLLARGA